MHPIVSIWVECSTQRENQDQFHQKRGRGRLRLGPQLTILFPEGWDMDNTVDKLESAEIGIDEHITDCLGGERAQQVRNRMVETNRLLVLDGLPKLSTVLEDAGELRSGIHVLQRWFYFFGVEFANNLKLVSGRCVSDKTLVG